MAEQVYRVSIEVVIPVRAESCDAAIDKASRYLAEALPDSFVAVTGSECILDNEE